MQRILNAIHYAQAKYTPLVLLLTDVEKAFDKIDWEFLQTALEYLGLGEGMRKWLPALCSSPSAALKFNEAISESFDIRNGTCQVCLLSPLIFMLTLEPFLQTIRSWVDIHSLPTNLGTHKLAPYADDLIFFVTLPLTSLSNLFDELTRFGSLSNFKIKIFQVRGYGN